MTHYRAVFKLQGDRELEASNGYVPDAFFDAVQRATVDNIVAVYTDAFRLTVPMHELLEVSGAFTSYAVAGMVAPEGTDREDGFAQKMLEILHAANHARPLPSHFDYQVFFMEHTDPDPDE